NGEIAGLLRGVPDEGPDRLVRNQLEATDEYSNAGRPARPDQQPRARFAPLPSSCGYRNCCDHCIQRRIKPEPYSHSITMTLMMMMIAAAELNSYRSKAVSSVAPIPPPPTMPITADSRKLMSKRYSPSPIMRGITCG